MNKKILDRNFKISHTIVTHFRASKLRLKPRFMPRANFQFDPKILYNRNLHINVQIAKTIILILDQVESIKNKISIYA